MTKKINIRDIIPSKKLLKKKDNKKDLQSYTKSIPLLTDSNIIDKYMKQLTKKKLDVAIKDMKKAKIAKETSD